MPPKTAASSSPAIGNEAKKVWDGYWSLATHQILIIDAFLAFLVAVGVIQTLYFIFLSRDPFNAYIAGFIATVGEFVLTVALRMQTQEQNKTQFPKVTPERSFADYIFGSLVLQLFCVNYLN